ncbi:MAG: hypothetical protein H7Y42_09915 [Chitinophagaceae bacterium]|nr:hypothetical protein [Chitinophagaceae bacterium]
MPTNEFEKQVQKQMEDFQLNPSATVWEKVEEQIKEKKRRRRLFFIIPTAILLSGLSYLYFTSGDRFAGIKSPSVLQNNNESNSTNSGTTTPNGQASTPAQSFQSEKSTNTPSTVASESTASSQNLSASNQGTTRRNDPLRSSSKESVSVSSTKAASGRATATGSQQPSTINIISKDPTLVKSSQTVSIKDTVRASKINPADEKLKSNDKVEEPDTLSIVKETQPAEIKIMAARKIRFAIDLSGGVTAPQDGLFSMAKAMAMDNLNSSPGTGSGGVGQISPPSQVRSGPSFKIGLMGEKQLTRRSRLSAGVEYSYLSTKMKTGSRADTTVRVVTNSYATVEVDRVYRGAPNNEFTNKYHFVSIPVWYHLQLNKGRTLPIQWNIGLTTSYLVSTNALLYSGGLGGIYYHDKSAYNKLHFNLGSGISLRFNTRKSVEWTLGPSVSFDMTRLVEGDKQYLFFGGLTGRVYIPKKKNN